MASPQAASLALAECALNFKANTTTCGKCRTVKVRHKPLVSSSLSKNADSA